MSMTNYTDSTEKNPWNFHYNLSPTNRGNSLAQNFSIAAECIIIRNAHFEYAFPSCRNTHNGWGSLRVIIMRPKIRRGRKVPSQHSAAVGRMRFEMGSDDHFSRGRPPARRTVGDTMTNADDNTVLGSVSSLIDKFELGKK